MKLRDIRRAFGRHQRRQRPARYGAVTAECREELALIADRRRSDLDRL